MITFSETIDKKHTGSRDSSGCFSFPPIPLFLPPQGFPTAAFFLFPLLRKMSFFAESLNAIVIEN